MKAATVPLAAAALFFAGVLTGSIRPSDAPADPAPVVLTSSTGEGPAGRPSATPRPSVEEVEHEVVESEIEDAHTGPASGEDHSGPASGESDRRERGEKDDAPSGGEDTSTSPDDDDPKDEPSSGSGSSEPGSSGGGGDDGPGLVDD